LIPTRCATWTSGWPAALLADWRAFDNGSFQDRLDRLTHLRADIDGQAIHLVHAPGHGPGPRPLLLTHGWPGSFLEYAPLLPLLAEDFTLVIPSLPGYGFSAPPPPEGLTAREIAGRWHRLMTDGLGHDRYVAHGSDIGAGITAWLARDHPDAVDAIHLATPGLPVPAELHSSAEHEYAAAAQAWASEHGGYAHEHATKPATLGAALHDSPAGLAAWIGEKVVAWSSTHPDGEPAFDRDLLLGTLTLYWATGTIATSLLPYWAYQHRPETVLTPDDPSPVPTAVSIFGGEHVPFPKPPRSLAERYYRLTA
jgi:pimeloyl-ACP methyl ester carboxylesterase